MKYGPALGGILGPQHSMVRLGDRAADRQAQSEAMGLGGDEGLENPFGIAGSDARAIVLHRDFDGFRGRRENAC